MRSMVRMGNTGIVTMIVQTECMPDDCVDAAEHDLKLCYDVSQVAWQQGTN